MHLFKRVTDSLLNSRCHVFVVGSSFWTTCIFTRLSSLRPTTLCPGCGLSFAPQTDWLTKAIKGFIEGGPPAGMVTRFAELFYGQEAARFVAAFAATTELGRA